MATKAKKVKKVGLSPINFAVAKQARHFREILDKADNGSIDAKESQAQERLRDRYDGASEIKLLLTGKGETPFSHGKTKFYEGGSEEVTFMIQNGLVRTSEGYPEDAKVPEHFEAEGALVKFPKKHRQKLCVVANADVAEDAQSGPRLVQAMSQNGLTNPTVSFRCIARFFKDTKDQDVAKMFTTGQIVLVDFTPDDRIPLKADEKKVLAKISAAREANAKTPKKLTPVPTLKPPKAGYMLVGHEWHRSGSTLLRSKKGMYILCGQDENTYFGVELPPGRYTTVEQAYVGLMPEAVKGRSDFIRQGEWFAIPVAAEAVPEEQDRLLTWTASDTTTDLYPTRDTDDSAKHFIGQSQEVIVGKNGNLYVRGLYMNHERGDHEEVNMSRDTWCVLHKNRAVRSFSEEGRVD